jgi:hypothetical protein
LKIKVGANLGPIELMFLGTRGKIEIHSFSPAPTSLLLLSALMRALHVAEIDFPFPAVVNATGHSGC